MSSKTAVGSDVGDGVIRCDHERECGACAFLGAPYPAELSEKRAVLTAELERYQSLRGASVLPCMPSPRISGYRSRAKMVVAWGGRGHRVRLGYFRLGTREVVDAPACQVLDPDLLETSRRIRDVLSSARPDPASLRFIDLRSGSDPRQQHLTLVIGSSSVPRLPLREIERACPFVHGVSINLNPGSGSQVLRGPVKHAWGEPRVAVDLHGITVRVSPASFFQVNLHLLSAIHQRMRAFIEGSEALADLYAGVGTHALGLASAVRRMLLIEGVPAAARDAHTAIEEANFTHAHVVNSPVERALRRFLAERADAVILNPSRQGADPSVLRAIADSCARRVAYLSCDPKTLARDLDELARLRFRIHSIEPIDMMPQTRQVEALALIDR